MHGGQQLALFNAHYDSHCFLPIHIYEAATGKPVAIFLRPGKTPDGIEVACMLRHVIRQIRARWPRVEILIRGDSHYGRIEAIALCERHRVGYIFGLAGNRVLLRKVADLAEDGAVRRLYRESAPPWRNRLRRQGLADATRQHRAAHHRPRRGWPPGNRHALHHHQSRRHARASLRRHLLRARPGRESDQGAQAAPRFRPHVMHQSHRQPVPSAGPHRSVLAHGHAARPGAEAVVLARCPVRYHPRQPAQGRVTEMATRIKVALPTAYPYQESWLLLAERAVTRPP